MGFCAVFSTKTTILPVGSTLEQTKSVLRQTILIGLASKEEVIREHEFYCTVEQFGSCYVKRRNLFVLYEYIAFWFDDKCLKCHRKSVCGVNTVLNIMMWKYFSYIFLGDQCHPSRHWYLTKQWLYSKVVTTDKKMAFSSCNCFFARELLL